MSFLFPRTVTITRPAHQTAGAGAGGYGGQDRDKETTVATGKPASIQTKGTGRGRANPTDLPGDSSPFRWVILIPNSAAIPEGAVLDGDFVTDDKGRRFRVSANYFHSMGWTLQCEIMEK